MDGILGLIHALQAIPVQMWLVLGMGLLMLVGYDRWPGDVFRVRRKDIDDDMARVARRCPACLDPDLVSDDGRAFVGPRARSGSSDGAVLSVRGPTTGYPGGKEVA